MDIVKSIIAIVDWISSGVSTLINTNRAINEEVKTDDKALESNKPKSSLYKFLDFVCSPSALRFITIGITLTTLVVSSFGIAAITIAAATILSTSAGVIIESLRLQNLKNRELENKILTIISNDSKIREEISDTLSIQYGSYPKTKEFSKSWSVVKATLNGLPENAVSLVGPILTANPVTIGLTSLCYITSYLNTVKERIALDRAMVDLRNDTANLKDEMTLRDIKLDKLLSVYNSSVEDKDKLKKTKFLDCVYETTIKSGFSIYETFKSFTPKKSEIKINETIKKSDKPEVDSKIIPEKSVGNTIPSIIEPAQQQPHTSHTTITYAESVQESRNRVHSHSSNNPPIHR